MEQFWFQKCQNSILNGKTKIHHLNSQYLYSNNIAVGLANVQWKIYTRGEMMVSKHS